MRSDDRGGGGSRPKRKPRPRRRPTPAPAPPRPDVVQGGYTAAPSTRVPPRHTVFTSPLGGPALHQQRREQRDKVRRAQDKLPGPAVVLPRRPQLRNYTEAQRREIITSTSAAIRKAAASGQLDDFFARDRGDELLMDKLGHLTDRQTRTAIHKYAGALQTRQRNLDILLGKRATQGRLLSEAPTLKNLAEIGRRARQSDVAGAAEASPLHPMNRKSNLAGVLDDRVFNYAPNLRVLTAPFELARATAEDPLGVAEASVRTGIESIAGIPQGIKALAENPKEGLKAIADDYSHRYGPLLEGNTAKFRQQVKEESGVTPFVLDAAAAGAPVGRVAGAAARSGATARAADALTAAKEPILSRVLRAANQTATMERPNLRYSGGEAGVVPQATSRNLFVAAGQRGIDTSRRRAFEKRAKRAGVRPAANGQLERIPGASTSGRLPALRPGANEVLPYLSPREGPTRRLTGRVARDIGAAKGKGRLRLLTRRGKALEDIERQMKRLTPEESAALFPVIKYGLPAVTDAKSRGQALAAIERRLAQIKRERKSSGRGVSRVLDETNDEVRLLRRIRDDPDTYLTPNLRAAADELRAVQRREEEFDPDLPADRAQIRRDTPQGALLGVRRGPDAEYLRERIAEIELVQQARGRQIAPGQLQESHGALATMAPDQRPEAATKLEAQARARANATKRTLAAAKEGLAAATGRAQILSRNVTGTRDGENRAEAGGGLGVAQARQEVAEAETAAKAAGDALTAAQAVTKAVKSKDSMRLESADAFDSRVRQAAEDAGLEEPGYWMSMPRPQETYSDAAIGTGGRAAARSRTYTGALSKIGAETHTPDVFTKGVERNIKRRFSWALVSRNMDVHAFEWSRGRQGEGLTASQILRELDDRHIDAGSVAFMNSRIVRKRDAEPEGGERGEVVDEALLEDNVMREANTELLDARTTLKDLQSDQAQGLAQNRYLVVPKMVADELEAATRPDGIVGRSLEIILKQKPARILLGTFNTPWLSFQIASNAFLTGLGGGRNPLDVYGAHKWWRGLSDAEKDAIEIELGITRGKHFAMDQTRLGSTRDDLFGPVAHMAHFWQAYKKSRIGRLGHKGNPLDLMFRVDEAQNNFFRKVLFYNQAKKTAYKNMGASWRSMDGLQKKLLAAMSVPPEKLGGNIAKRGPEFETHAKKVNDFLGNYLTFSNRERQLLSRNVMFYGYLRFSLRFAFWTMPVEHPVMTAMLTNIGRMGAQEIKELFGVPDTYRLPTSMIANVYSGATPEEVQDYIESEGQRGKLPTSSPLGRMNPALNALTQMEGAQQIVGLASPLYQMIADQMFEESSFTGRDYRIKGQTTPSESQRPKNYYGSMWGMFVPGTPRNRIALADLLGMVYPYRLATKVGIPGVAEPLEGPQSDDSLLGSPRPMRYKDPEIVKSIKKSIDREREKRSLLPQLLPITGKEDLGPVIIDREREREADAADRSMDDKKPSRKKKRKAPAGAYGGTSSSGSQYGGSGGSGSTNYKSRYGG